MKRFFVLLLVLILCPILAYAEDVHKSGDYEYIVKPDGTAEITMYTGSAEHLTLPETLGGYPVTSIGDIAFYKKNSDDRFNCTTKTITIPNQITELGKKNPFYACLELMTFVVADDHPTLYVEDDVLFSRPDARLVTYPRQKKDQLYKVPEGTRIIGDLAMFENQYILAVILPDSVVEIRQQVFVASSLQEIVLSDHLKTIGYAAFYKSDLRDIILPDSVTSIGEIAFHGCTSLSMAVLPEKLLEIPADAFSFCDKLTTVIVTSPLTTIGKQAFWGCTNLKIFKIPETCINIDDTAFGGGAPTRVVTVSNMSVKIGCSYCDGFGDVRCKYCDGDGMCRACGGIGRTSRIGWNYDIEYQDCSSCYWGECSFCRDNGRVPGWVWCTYCGGSGEL